MVVLNPLTVCSMISAAVSLYTVLHSKVVKLESKIRLDLNYLLLSSLL